MDKLYLLRHAAALAAASLLAACGGGGGDDTPASTSTPTGSTDTTVEAPGETATATPTTSAYSGNCNVANFTTDTLAQVNAFRAQSRVCGTTTYPAAAALVWNEKLAKAAFGHSTSMATNNYFSHTGIDGSNPGQRITAAGYPWSRYGENIAAGQPTMTSVMTSWQNSAGHCANLMNAKITQIGLSCVKGGTGATYSTYWTMTLATPQ